MQINSPGGEAEACSDPSSLGWRAQTQVKKSRPGGRREHRKRERPEHGPMGAKQYGRRQGRNRTAGN